MSTGLRFTLEVDGLPPDALAVTSFHLEQSLSSLFTLNISLVSSSFSALISLRFWKKQPILKSGWARRYSAG